MLCWKNWSAVEYILLLQYEFGSQHAEIISLIIIFSSRTLWVPVLKYIHLLIDTHSYN